MILLREDLKKLEAHWAVAAIPADLRQRAHTVANARLVRSALAGQLKLSFVDAPGDDQLLERATLAYELAAIDGPDALNHPTASTNTAGVIAQAGAFRAFELCRSLAIPEGDLERVFHILRLASLAYIGDRWSDLRRWLIENRERTAAPHAANLHWDKRVLYRVYEGWLRLFRKDSWNDLHGIAEIVAGLREEQRIYEEELLRSNAETDGKAMAYRLIALYHWARATELLSKYMLQGQPPGIAEQLDLHFDKAIEATAAARDMAFEVLLRWLHTASRRMVAGSLWTATAGINSRVGKFVRALTTAAHPMIELLPPQRSALMEKGLLDPATRAIVVDLPTSGGKTTLAQFRILQALNQHAEDKGWVAYVAPTRALVAQLLRRLRRDFGPLGIKVEQVCGGIEVDALEDELLERQDSFDILISTPEKLNLLIRNKKLKDRPLALVVLDEAHNIEDPERGLRIELTLATIRQDCPLANYLLLTPFVPEAQALASWLDPVAGKPISLGTTAWQPNERIVGLFHCVEEESDGARKHRKWRLEYETVTTTPRTIHLKGKHAAGTWKPLILDPEKACSLMNQTAAMAKVFSTRGTSIAVGATIPRVWKMARTIAKSIEPPAKPCEEVELVRDFLRTEVGEDFELVSLLEKRVAVHHAGLPEDARTLVEWLAEEDRLRVLCATTTIAQGINFPVSSVFLSQVAHPSKKGPIPMTYREFWNLAGRAGRVHQDSVGVVGIATKGAERAQRLKVFLAGATNELASRLIGLLEDLVDRAPEQQLSAVVHEDQWSDFRSFVAHLLREAKDIQQVQAQAEQLLRSTFGYSVLRGKTDARSQAKAKTLLNLTNGYAQRLAENMGALKLADSTGFDPEGVRKAMGGLHGLEKKLTASDWEPQKLFGDSPNLANLVGLMMTLPRLKQLEEIAGTGQDRRHIAEIAKAWIGGSSVQEIATQYFAGKDSTEQISTACRAIYRSLANYGVWGLAALSRLPGSGINWDKVSEDQQRRLSLLPAFMYHGVNTEEAVLMRMNQVPRSVAQRLGSEMRKAAGDATRVSIDEARRFVKDLKSTDWERAKPEHSALSGSQYREIWGVLSGEGG
jgi:hypothetical protein